ncbi:MAG TPA: hypothetical protein VK348_12985 [Planctomycetota bacterium]|nr:hypothetical protein [Planctomycetota bacterium]
MRHGQLGVLLAITTIVDAQNLDLAPLGTATQSAIAFGGNPLRAIDGNRDGIFAHNSVTHTPNQAGNYLEVVIPVNLVHEIVLYNRADCCGSRLANFRVEAWLTGVLLFTRDFFISGGAVAQGGTLRIPLPAPGLPIDTMRVTQLGPGPSNEQVLSLAEVELIQYGVQAEVNLAPFGSASLTNPNYATTGREAIDGRTDGFFNNGSVTHTLDMPGNVWRVDLPFRSDLHVIRLWNRTDCCGDRLSNFRLSVFDGATEVFGQDFYTLGGGVPITGPEIVSLPASTAGTAVQVALLGPGTTGNQILSLAEVEVIRYGMPPVYAPYGTGCAGSAGTPTLQALSPSQPAIGTTFTLRIGNVPSVPGFAFLVFGLSATRWNGNLLPFDLAVFGAPGCLLVASADGAMLLAQSGGNADLALAMPNERLLLGAVLYHQALALDAAAGNALGATVSNGARLVIGL